MKKEHESIPIKLFYSYSHKDERFREKLETHLSILRRQNLLAEWHDRKIVPGMDWETQIDQHLNNSQIIILLVSADFLSSKYCYDIEMAKAIQKQEAGEACIIPIILRPVDFSGIPFSEFQALPKDGKPVTSFKNQDEAWVNISKGIHKVCEIFKTHGTYTVANHLNIDTNHTNFSCGNMEDLLDTKGVITGNRVFVRLVPTVGARWIVMLDQGEEVEVLKSIVMDTSWECQLVDDIFFVPESGRSYVLRAGRGLIISGQKGDEYRVEIKRKNGTDIGFVPKDKVVSLQPSKWFFVKKNLLEGWIYHRYLRVYRSI